MRARLLTVAALVALVASATLTSGATAHTRADPLTIYAAASLTEVFKALDGAQRYSFAGSNALETQIRNGAPADVFASAAPLNAERLFSGRHRRQAGHVHGEPSRVDRAEVEPGRHHVDLRPAQQAGQAGRRRARGSGRRLHGHRPPQDGALERAERGRQPESDVKAVTGKVALGQADAGFVYVTDARPVSDQVTVIRIPAWAQPRVRYEIAVVSKSPNKAAARAWVKMVLSAKGQTALRRAGFLPLPKASS